jgi:uroporphyrinogen-III synthase
MVAAVLAAIGVVLAFTLRRRGVPPTSTAEPAGEQGLAVAA